MRSGDSPSEGTGLFTKCVSKSRQIISIMTRDLCETQTQREPVTLFLLYIEDEVVMPFNWITATGSNLFGATLMSHRASTRTDPQGMQRLLAVDDDEDILEVIKEMLKSCKPPIHADTFRDPERALKHFRSKQEGYYPVVLVDVRMPRMSGFAFAKEIRSLSHKVKIVMMSAFEMKKKEFDSNWPTLDVAEFLSKPFTLKQLESVITRYMDISMNVDRLSSTGNDDGEPRFSG
jgi:CheY-like chemotaxis protein